MGIFLVYGVDDNVSFKNLESWIKQIKAFAAQDVVIILIGNKRDSKR